MVTKNETKYTEILCIGLGFSGICLGVQLKRKFGFDDIHFYDQNPSVAGTWYANQYPGVACDIHAGLYSFSFEPNLDWTRGLANGEEIKDYLNRVVDKYNLRPNMTFSVEWLSAKWDESRQVWSVELKDLKEDKKFIHECRILYSAVGQLVIPKPADIPGISTFQGEIFHTARWRKDVSLKDKDVIIIGNGCSASQVVPLIVNETKSLTQFFRSAQWIFPGEDGPISPQFRWCLKHVPLVYRLQRLYIYLATETFGELFRLTKQGAKVREHWAAISKEYILSAAPEKYHSMLIPDYVLGCKRRIFDKDSGYMTALHSPNMLLTKEPIQRIVPEGVSTANKVYPADVIILANGFQTGLGGLNTIDVYGRNGQSLHEYWKKFGGPMTYNCTAVSDFPNFFMLMGPNTATGHTSVIIAIENIVNYTLKIIKPILTRKALSVDVKKSIAESYGKQLQQASRSGTMLNSCRNFYVVDGWNSVVYPWSQYHFWWRSAFPRWKDWSYTYNPKGTRSRRILLLGIGLILLSAGYINRHVVTTLNLKGNIQDILTHIVKGSAQ